MRKRLRPWLMAALGGLVVTGIVALSPSTLEQSSNSKAGGPVDPETFSGEDEVNLATGIPKEKIPEYSVNKFQYVSTQAGEKQWKLHADRAFLYNHEKMVHARQIRAYLYDPDGQTTLVTGKEAKYFMNKRDLEIFGDVHTTFPDGFVLNSDYLHYRPNDRHIMIPPKYHVEGYGDEQDGQKIQFTSYGMDFAMGRSEITLPKDVHMVMVRKTQPISGSKARAEEPDKTTIESDRAIIHRDKQISYFTMSPNRPIGERFVKITQPTMITHARRAQLNYGDFSKMLQYMTVFEDVTIREISKNSSPQDKPITKYATSGRADFDAKSDIIRLTEFPQVYQDNDTVTGDIIIMHRDTDLVEVEHSNAFIQGSQ